MLTTKTPSHIFDLHDVMFIDHMWPYLMCVKDYWSLANTCRRYYACLTTEPLKSIVRKLLLRNLDLVLREFYLDSHSMTRILSTKFGSILSGSSVLQAYLGEQWDSPSDLDIYIPYDALHDLTTKSIANAIESVTSNFSNCSTSSTTIWRRFSSQHSTLLTTTDYRISTIDGPYIHESVNGKIVQINLRNGRKIQLIFVKTYWHHEQTGEKAEYIVKLFDLTVVQNSFDGQRFHSRYIDHVLHKKMEFTSHWPDSNTATDGTINDFPWWVPPPEYRAIDEPNISRLQKYERRGFRFDLPKLPLWTTPLARMYLIKVRNLRNDIKELRTDFRRKVHSLKRTLKKQKSKIVRLTTIRQGNQINSTMQQNSAQDS